MEIVILIIICAIVSNKIKKAKMEAAIASYKKKEKEKEAVVKQTSAPAVTVVSEEKQRERELIRARAMENIREGKQRAEAIKEGKPKVEMTPAGQKEGQSTTEYLAWKAKADQIAHSRDSRQEEQRLRRETGGKAPALRHYYGDSVPPKMRLVRCGYCAADNLVAEYANVKNYTCYFCREDL